MKVKTLGILGGGQLAQMLALAALPLGVRVVVLEPDALAPARLCAEHLHAPYTDPVGLNELAACEAVTLEFEKAGKWDSWRRGDAYEELSSVDAAAHAIHVDEVVPEEPVRHS